MERMVLDFGRMYRERNEALQEVARAHHDALLRLSRAAEYRDDDTGVHIVRIGFIAEALALRLGQRRPLRRTAAQGRADARHRQDRRARQRAEEARPADARGARGDEPHPKIGAEILGRSRIPLFQLAAEVALSHHERWDGSGYPSRLAGEAIPLSGRIVAVVDFFDALTMDRCYRPAFSDDQR
jgi:putative two-component system response regulator